MRICLISFEYLPCTNYGGAAALYFDLANGLASRGHEVFVLSGNSRPGIEEVRESGVINVRFDARRPSMGFAGRLWRSWQVFRVVREVERDYGAFDVLESPEVGAEPLIVNSMMKRASVARLITPSFLLARMSGKKVSVVQNVLERENAKLSSIVIGDSPNWCGDIMREWRMKNEQCRQCSIGLDLNRIDEVPFSSAHPFESYVLFSGRLTVAKGPHVLATASAKIIEENPSVKIVFAGADRKMPSGESMKEYILRTVRSEVRKSLIFMGRIDSWAQLVNLYRGATVCVKADVYGNHSFDVMGQMACSRPLVCTRTEGNTDTILDGVNGLLFDRGYPDQLSSSVNQLLDDETLRASIGRAARETIETRFSSSIMASQTESVYESILET